jgi:hypothetical protein
MQELNLKLLPRSVKLVALALLPATMLIFFIIDKLQLGHLGSEMVFTTLKSVLLISALFFITSKDKIENEVTMRLRLQAMAGAFCFGILLFSIQPFTNLAFEGSFSFSSDFGIFQLFFTMILFYLTIFYYSKWKYGLSSMIRKKA